VRDEPDRVLLQVKVRESGASLVLMDSLFPGWRASVDGESAPIYLANHAFRAVPLPEGDHTVEFRYEPATYRVGLFVSLLTLGMLLSFGGACLVSSRARAPAMAL